MLFSTDNRVLPWPGLSWLAQANTIRPRAAQGRTRLFNMRCLDMDRQDRIGHVIGCNKCNCWMAGYYLSPADLAKKWNHRWPVLVPAENTFFVTIPDP